jgi:hypothetical protein
MKEAKMGVLMLGEVKMEKPGLKTNETTISMDMKRHFRRTAGLCCALFGLLAGAAGALRADVSIYSGGGEIPTPFSVTNRYVELADGESYDLVGQVVGGSAISNRIAYGQQQAWFLPDFTAQPWLANAKRVSNPGYPMQDALWSSWAAYSGQLVHMSVIAHGVVMNGEYVIFLEPGSNTCDQALVQGKSRQR